MNEALLKLFLDTSCTIELGKGVSDSYVINSNVPTGHSDIEFKKHIYIKNVGTHKAYNISAYLFGSDVDGTTISPIKETLEPNETDTIIITKHYSKGERSSKVLSVGVEYDNIP